MDHGPGDPIFGFCDAKVWSFPGLRDGLLRRGSDLQEEFKLWAGHFWRIFIK